MKIDLTKIANQTTSDDIIRAAQAQLNMCSVDDVPFLTDLLIGINYGGQPILQMLERYEKSEDEGLPAFRWRLKVLRDEWGNPPVPGEYVTRKIKKTLYKKTLDGTSSVPIPSTEINYAIANGSYAKRFLAEKKFRIDKKGCISCKFSDASIFLQQWGVHSDTGFFFGRHAHKTSAGKTPEILPITDKNQYSRQPVLTPEGQHRHVHYWRYTEMQSADYDKLKNLKTN